MSRRNNYRNGSSQLYHPNDMSLTLDNDASHQKMWIEKVEEAKHIQEQKQIDRILTGIIKEKLFGNLLAEDSRISDEGYYNLDRIGKKLMNPIKLPFHKKIHPLPTQPEFSRITRNSYRSRTIDTGSRLKAQTIDASELPETRRRRLSKKNSVVDGDSMNDTRRGFLPKQLSISKLSNNINAHFREITGNQTSMIYDIKMTKQMLLEYSKKVDLVNRKCFERFIYFFSFPNSCNFRQYSNWVETAANCSIR